tara:strand:- start:11 stop:685 length:675 start_codon:yes stop_codon:yes gene_type:complete
MNVLNHVAFIMDGNGRWGLKKRRSRNYGHLQGVKTVQKIVKISLQKKIPIISFYVFSSENWKRPKKEINFLFNLINIYFKKELQNIVKNNIKINIIGRTKKLPIKIRKILEEVTIKTSKNKKLIVNLAINYGSKKEIVDSVKRIIFKKRPINEENISKYLYFDIPHPDVLIRTGGKKRLSNFMLWQLAYAELFFIDKLWPDFNKTDFEKILKRYYAIKRNFGGI